MATTREGKTGRAQAETPAAPPRGEALQHRIREKAYELFLQRGRRHGRHLDDWLEAERIVLVEIRSRPSAGPQASEAAGRPIQLASGRRRLSPEQ